MTDKIDLPHSFSTVASKLDDVVRRKGFVIDLGCSSGALLVYLAHYLCCEGTGYEIVSDCAAMVRRIADKVSLEHPSPPSSPYSSAIS